VEKMELSVDEIIGWLTAFYWPFLRISALFMATPVFGARTVPVRIRIILALLVTLLLVPTLPDTTGLEPLSPAGLVITAQQILIGVLMGLTLHMMFAALVMAGMITATTMGLGFASTVDPQNGVQVTVLGQYYMIIATLLFLSVDGHLLLLSVLADSFVAIPLAGGLLPVEVLWNLVVFSAEMFLSALLIALPIMVGVLLVNLGLGVVTRAAPQLNIFAVGFPATMLTGFVLVLLCQPLLSPLLMDLFSNTFDFLRLNLN
jgi:flagellar biosynthetic protein FliR